MKETNHILIGNTFPMTLIRRRCSIEPYEIDEFKRYLEAIEDQPNDLWLEVHSYWGHKETITIANEMLGIDVTPETERPALVLSEDGLPILDKIVFDEVWVLNPTYVGKFRPEPGKPVTDEQISGWQLLKITFDKASFAIGKTL